MDAMIGFIKAVVREELARAAAEHTSAREESDATNVLTVLPDGSVRVWWRPPYSTEVSEFCCRRISSQSCSKTATTVD
jgi:hypothetical protein